MTRILIVEDEPRIASFVSRGLEAAGYETVLVEDGAEALAVALRGDADLVLLDVGLPTMDGFEVLRELRARGSVVPVIMLT
ncbi:MAG: response regulator, partial [Microbacterium sp.]